MIINTVTCVTSIFLFITCRYILYIVLHVNNCSKYYTHVTLYSINSGKTEVTQVTKLVTNKLPVTSCNL
jgi:hypothetical protein